MWRTAVVRAVSDVFSVITTFLQKAQRELAGGIVVRAACNGLIVEASDK